MKLICILASVVLVYSIGFMPVDAQATSSSKGLGARVALTVELNKSTENEVEYTLQLRNDGDKAIYYSSNPQDACGNRGPYVSTDKEKSSIADIQWRVFDPEIVQSIDCYSNEIRVELKRLQPGKTVQETVSTKWPLSETVPPYLTRSSLRTLDRRNVKRIRFTVGYFGEEAGILEFLTRKPFGWFIKGTESLEAGIFRGKRFSEIQQVASVEAFVPELKSR